MHLRARKTEERTLVLLGRIQKAVGIAPPNNITHTEVGACTHSFLYITESAACCQCEKHHRSQRLHTCHRLRFQELSVHV